MQPRDQQVHSFWTVEVTSKFADLIPTGPNRSPLKLKDVQQNELAITGRKTMPILVGPTGGKQAMEATATFRVAEVRNNILSLGKLVRKGFNFTLGPHGCSVEKDGRLHLQLTQPRHSATLHGGGVLQSSVAHVGLCGTHPSLSQCTLDTNHTPEVPACSTCPCSFTGVVAPSTLQSIDNGVAARSVPVTESLPVRACNT